MSFNVGSVILPGSGDAILVFAAPNTGRVTLYSVDQFFLSASDDFDLANAFLVQAQSAATARATVIVDVVEGDEIYAVNGNVGAFPLPADQRVYFMLNEALPVVVTVDSIGSIGCGS